MESGTTGGYSKCCKWKLIYTATGTNNDTDTNTDTDTDIYTEGNANKQKISIDFNIFTWKVISTSSRKEE